MPKREQGVNGGQEREQWRAVKQALHAPTAAPAVCTCDLPPALASRLLGPNHVATCPMYRAAPAEGETK